MKIGRRVCSRLVWVPMLLQHSAPGTDAFDTGFSEAHGQGWLVGWLMMLLVRHGGETEMTYSMWWLVACAMHATLAAVC